MKANLVRPFEAEQKEKERKDNKLRKRCVKEAVEAYEASKRAEEELNRNGF